MVKEVAVLNEKQVPLVVIRRLPRYHRYLGDLLDNNITRVSSTELSEKMGVTASQIRQDLNCFGGFGQQGYGYNVELLYQSITSILGLDRKHKIIIVGAGNLGRALANYGGLEKRGFEIIAVFDTDEKVIGTDIIGLKVRDYSQISEFIKNNTVDIAILTVPKANVNSVAEKVASCGVKALWNFAHVDLALPGDVVVENVHLSDSLMTLSFRMHNSGEVQ